MTTMHVDAFNVAHTTVGCDQFNGEYVGSIPLDKCATNHMLVCADCEPTEVP